jgi:5-methylcytosine-specific restriction endonuclease McrA
MTPPTQTDMPSGTSHGVMRMRNRLRHEGGLRACGICGGPVDMSLPPHDPYSFELDHVIPKKMGGPDDPANLRITHRFCNRSRGAGGRRANTPADRSAEW